MPATHSTVSNTARSPDAQCSYPNLRKALHVTTSADTQAFIASVMAGLTGPGGPFEMQVEDVLGSSMPVMKNRDKALGDVLAASFDYGSILRPTGRLVGVSARFLLCRFRLGRAPNRLDRTIGPRALAIDQPRPHRTVRTFVECQHSRRRGGTDFAPTPASMQRRLRIRPCNAALDRSRRHSVWWRPCPS